MKILSLDIETSPNLAYTWGIFDQNVGLNQLVETSEVLCFAARFLGEKKMHFRSVFHDGKEAMLQAIWELLDEADVVVHYNGQRFDIPHINRELLLAGMSRPAPFKQVDLYLVARRQFKWVSNKLDHVATQLGLGGKVKHEGFELWSKCLQGDEAAWARMRRYNKQDVVLLEGVHERLLPWIPSYPDRNLYDGVDECPRCGEGPMQRRGFAFTAQSKFQRWQCQACGSWTRSTQKETGVKQAGIV